MALSCSFTGVFVGCLIIAQSQAFPNRFLNKVKAGGTGDAWGDNTLIRSNSKVFSNSNGFFESFGTSSGVASGNGPSRVRLDSFSGSGHDIGLGESGASANGGTNAAAGHSSVKENNRFRGIGTVGVSATVCLEGDTQCTVASSAGTRDRNIGVNVNSGGGCAGGVCAGSSVSGAVSLLDKSTGLVNAFGNSKTSGISLD